MVTYDMLAEQDFIEWGLERYPHPSRVFGFACRRDGALVAIGCCWVDEDDNWRASFGGREGFPHGIHRKALDLFAALRRAGASEVRADLDMTVPKAREWLKRLGFAPVDSSGAEWRLELCV